MAKTVKKEIKEVEKKKKQKEAVTGDVSMLQKARQELIVLNLDNARKKLKNTSSIFVKRKEIARILTKMKEKELLNG